MAKGKSRIRPKGSSRTKKPRVASSSINPKSSRHRDAARAQRLANKCPLVAVDDRMEQSEALLQHVPMGEISLNKGVNKQGKHERTRATDSLPSTNMDGDLERRLAAEAALLKHLPFGELSLLEEKTDEIMPERAVELLEKLESVLSVQNVQQWKLVLEKMAALIGKAGSAVQGDVFSRVMGAIAELRDKDRCIFAEQIDALFGTVVRVLGIEQLLNSVPLNIDVEAPVLPQDFRRSWILPVVAKNVNGDSLDFFTRALIPLATRLHQRLQQLSDFPRKLYSTLERQIWAILPRCMAKEPRDFHSAMPTLAPILGATLNDRADLRLIILNTIRAALHFDAKNGGVQMMAHFARNFLPIMFSLYTNADDEDKKTTETQWSGAVDAAAIRTSALDTIRLYVEKVPKQLLAQYITLALKKISLDQTEELSEKKLRLFDLLTAMCKNAVSEDVQRIFDCVQHCFDHVSGRIQKKAYRILAEIYRRISDIELQPFFDGNRPFIDSLIQQGANKTDKIAFSWRIAIFRNIIDSLGEFDQLSKFCCSINGEVLAFFDRSNNRFTRQQAALCLHEMSSALIRLGLTADEEISTSTALEPIFTPLFCAIKGSKSGAEKEFICGLTALNILAQKHIRLMDATLVSQIIGHIGIAIRVSPPATRVLALRALRVSTAKMQPFTFEQYKDLVIECVLSQSTKNTTSRLRKANALVFELLLERLGLEYVLKAAGERSSMWKKHLKNLEKAQRRKQRRKLAKMGDEVDQLEVLSGGSRVLGTSRGSLVSGTSRMTARTAKADSIFDILADSSDEEGNNAGTKKSLQRHKKGAGAAKSRVSLMIEEDEDELLDLLDRKSMLQKVSVVDQEEGREYRTTAFSGKRMGKRVARRNRVETTHLEEGKAQPFKTNKEGKLLITDQDKKLSKKRKGSAVDDRMERKKNKREMKADEEEANEDGGESDY